MWEKICLNPENRSKNFMVKSTPQIIEIIDSVFDLDSCLDISKLIHQFLLPYIFDVIKSDQTEITDDRVYIQRVYYRQLVVFEFDLFFITSIKK